MLRDKNSKLIEKLCGRNDRIDGIARRNFETLSKIEVFRTNRIKRERPKSYDAETASDRQHSPFFGIQPCHAAGCDFVMLNANDDIVAKQYLWFGPDSYETEIVKQWVAWCQQPGDVLDIGGYTGLMSLLAARAHPKNVVHLFEPVGATMERANINVKLNGYGSRIHRHNVGASDREAMVEINHYRDSNFVGTGSSLHAKEGKEIIYKSVINTVAIDSYLPDVSASVIKIDVEGHELQCLQGMAETISRTRPPIVVEIWEHTRPEVFSLLRDLGYHLDRVEPRELPVNNYFAT